MTDIIKYWRCPNCGQTHFGDNPPDICDFCEDFTTWKRLTVQENDTRNINPSPRQLDLFPQEKRED